MTNLKTTKGALLSSVVALLVCFTMLLGTTFAWFTDSVTSSNNIIQSGNLDVELYYQAEGKTDWTKVNANTNVFMENALWEPGHTEVVKLKVVNEGSLALKYNLGVNVASETGSVNVEGKDFLLSDYIKYGIVDGAQTYTREQAVTAVEATATKLNQAYNSGTTALEAKNDTNSDEKVVTMVVYMPQEVGNEANFAKDAAVPTINLGLNLFATQYTAENDSFGDNCDEYAGLPWDGESKEDPKADENGVIHVTNAAELVAMMDTTGNSIYSGKTIVLDADINLGGKTVKGIGGDDNFAGVFDGQGHTISNFTVDASNRSYYAGLFNQVSHGGTVKNLTVKGATIIGNSMVGAVASSVDLSATVDNCRAIGCTLIGVKKVGAVVGYSAGSTVTNNYAENCAVYYSEKEGAEILGYEYTGSTVNNNTFTDVEVVNATVILDADDLVYFAKSVNVDGETYAGKTVKLIADIDLANRNWLPIGMIGHEMGSTYPWYYAPFCGTFDGNGYTISNMKTCDMWNVGNYQYFNGAALFGCTSDGAVIKNLTIKNAIVLGTAGNGGAGYAYASAVVGNHWKGSLTFENVSVEDSGIYGSAHIGCLLGIAGREKSNPATITFTNCTMKNITEVYVNKTHNNGDVIGTDGHFNPTIIGEDSVVQNNVTVKQDRDEFYRIKAEYFPDLT